MCAVALVVLTSWSSLENMSEVVLAVLTLCYSVKNILWGGARCANIMLNIENMWEVALDVLTSCYSVENMCEVALVVLTFYIFFNPGNDPSSQHISGIIILLR